MNALSAMHASVVANAASIVILHIVIWSLRVLFENSYAKASLRATFASSTWRMKVAMIVMPWTPLLLIMWPFGLMVYAYLSLVAAVLDAAATVVVRDPRIARKYFGA